MSTTTVRRNSMIKSEGHIAQDERFEYFVYQDEVYRAPLDCPIRCDVLVRNGARWFARSITAAQALFDTYPSRLEMI